MITENKNIHHDYRKEKYLILINTSALKKEAFVLIMALKASKVFGISQKGLIEEYVEQ